MACEVPVVQVTCGKVWRIQGTGATADIIRCQRSSSRPRYWDAAPPRLTIRDAYRGHTHKGECPEPETQPIHSQ